MSRDRSTYGKCQSCRTPLLQARGYAGTDLCGPCCTGEADTLGEVTIECPKHGHVVSGNGRCGVCAHEART